MNGNCWPVEREGYLMRPAWLIAAIRTDIANAAPRRRWLSIRAEVRVASVIMVMGSSG